MGPEWRSTRDWPVTATRRAVLHIPPPWGSCNSKISSANMYLIPVSAKKTPIRKTELHIKLSPRTPNFNVEAMKGQREKTKHTPKLKSIQLSNNTLGTISLDVFAGLDKLQILNLSGNSLDENWIRPGSFNGLHSLVVLDLSSNHISRIEAGLLSDASALQYLDMGHNHIHTIAPSLHTFLYRFFISKQVSF